MALVEGVKYGLSSQGNSSAKKLVIFVKLTDSALRAIEDCLQQQQKTGQHATLQFLGNEGRIHIPSSSVSNDCHSFDFSLSSNADIEGPQGSFECIQQNGSRSLESMGTLPFKMRIHAKDDVYDLTRQKINDVEITKSQNCAKEIKQPGAENGRKAKHKRAGGFNLNPVSRRDSSPISNGYSNSKSSLLGNSKFSNGYQNSSSNYYGSHHYPSYKHGGGINSHANGPSSKMSGVNMDVSRRPLRERLIHMLALKPLKKPEIVAKLYRDGWKEKEKKMLMMTLTQMSQLKDNVYNLSRHIWNDVHEDWPFYTEEERQIMKRRKPQNLTPPGSDCSVGSGTSGSSSSPRSTTSGSGHSPTSYTSSGNYSSSGSHHNLYSNNSSTTSSGSSYGHAMNKSSSSNYSSHNMMSGGAGTQQPLPQQQQGVKRPNTNAYDNNNNNDNIPPRSKIQRVSHFKQPNCRSGSISANLSNSNSSSRGGDNSKDSPNGKESSSSIHLLQVPSTQPNQQQTSPYHQQRNYGNHERWSPTMNSGLAPPNNHRSPKNIKDHHSPSYNNNVNNLSSNINQSSSNHHHSSNHNSQGNFGEDFHSAATSGSSNNGGNNTWSSRNGSGGGHPLHNSHHHSSSSSAHQDNGLDLKLSDVEDSDMGDSGNGSTNSTCGASNNSGSQQHQSSSVNASVNNHPVNSNHSSGSSTKSSVYSSSLSSSASHTSSLSASSAAAGYTDSDSLVNNINNNSSNVNGVSLNSTVTPKRERDYDNSSSLIISNNLPSGCNRVSSTTNSGSASGFHTPQSCSPDSQIESLAPSNHHHPLSQHPPPSSQQQQQHHHPQLHWKPSSRNNNNNSDQHPKELVDKDIIRENNHLSESRGKSRHSNNGLPGSRDKVKDRSRSDRDRDKDRGDVVLSERDCDRPKSEIPEYVLEYPPIRTVEQRNRYKADFNAQYSEYRDLHSVIDEVKKKFAQLQENLLKEDKGSEKYQVVKEQIITEYNYNKNNKRYTDARGRYSYMHEKLSHIKRLVTEFDNSLMHSTPDAASGPGCPDQYDEASIYV